MNTPHIQSVSDLVNELRQGHVTKLASSAPGAAPSVSAPVDPVAASREKIARAAREAQELLKQANANASSQPAASAPAGVQTHGDAGQPVSSILPVSAPVKTANSTQMELQASLASAELMGAAVFDGMLKRGSQYIQGRQIREAQQTKEASVANEYYKVAHASACAMDQLLGYATQPKHASAQPSVEDVAQALYKVANASARAMDQILGPSKHASAPADAADPAGGVTLARSYVHQVTGGRVDPKLAAHAHDIDISINDIYQAMLTEFDRGINAATQVFG